MIILAFQYSFNECGSAEIENASSILKSLVGLFAAPRNGDIEYITARVY